MASAWPVHVLQREENGDRSKLGTRWLGGLGRVSAQGFLKQELENANVTATGCGVLTRGPALAWTLVCIISHNWCSKRQPSELLCRLCARIERIEPGETKPLVQGDADGGGIATKADLSLKPWVCPYLL